MSGVYTPTPDDVAELRRELETRPAGATALELHHALAWPMPRISSTLLALEARGLAEVAVRVPYRWSLTR